MKPAALALTSLLAIVALAPATSAAAGIDAPGAEAGALAEREWARGDVVSVSETSTMSRATIDAVGRAAADAGGQALEASGAQVGLVALTRGSATVQAPPDGYRIPMGLTVLPAEAAYATMSPAVARVLAAGRVVLGETSAAMRGAQVGDVVGLLDPSGGVAHFTIGRIGPDVEVGGAELVMAPAQAATLGVTDTTRVLVWGMDSRAAIDTALEQQGLVRRGVRIARSWDLANPDATPGIARWKQLVGEFAFRPLAKGDAALEPGWTEAHITERRTYAGVPIRARCNVALADALQGALQEIADSGLAGAIDTANTNAYGGCFYPRLNRVTGNLGFLSRHSWGAALDMNTTQNPQGRAPRLDCRVVRIFRKWGFAWGGNFVNPDGMHFEYVGERRDTWPYPSTYCPNLTTGSADRIEQRQAAVAEGDAGRLQLFAEGSSTA